MRASPVALLKHQIVEQAREIAELQHKLAKREEGSLYDLKHDSADDIATAIVGTLSAHKAKNSRRWHPGAAEEVAETRRGEV